MLTPDVGPVLCTRKCYVAARTGCPSGQVRYTPRTWLLAGEYLPLAGIRDRESCIPGLVDGARTCLSAPDT